MNRAVSFLKRSLWRPHLGLIEVLVVVVISLGLTIVNQLQVIIHWFTNPPERQFTGISHYFADYFLYTTQMAQGVSGNLLYRYAFTNEVLPPTWIYWFNLLLGNLGHVFGLSAAATYNLSLAVLVFALLLLWYLLARLLYPQNRLARLTCFIIIVSSTSFFDLGPVSTRGTVGLLGYFWFSPTLAFNRLGGVPHQAWQTILFVLLTMSFSSLLASPGIKRSQTWLHGYMVTLIGNQQALSFIGRIGTYWSDWYLLVGLVILAALASTANPVQMLLFVGAALLTTAWVIWKAKRVVLSMIFPFILIAILSLFGAFITNREFASQPVLTAAKHWELLQYVKVTMPQFILAVGPAGMLALAGLIPFFKRLTALRLLLFSFGLLSLLAFFLPTIPFLTIARVRYLHPASYIFVGLLATEGILALSGIINRVSKKKIPLLSIFLMLTLPALHEEIALRFRSNPALSSNLNHVPKQVVEALIRLGSQNDLTIQQFNNSSSVVLTDPSLPYDVLVPVFTGLKSFTGHPIHTLSPEIKEKLRQRFFAGSMSIEEAKSFLVNHRINYIVGSVQTTPVFNQYSFLSRSFANASLVIYQSTNKKATNK